jgi:arylsulfatase A-like enzyme
MSSRAGGPARRGGDQPPSVLLLTIDTLRPDYLSANGYDRPTSPYLDSLLADSFYFERAVTPIARTTPALASLLTGAYPHTTGVRTLTGSLASQVTSVVEVFRDWVYQTIAVVTNHVLKPERNLDRGFQVYDWARDIRTGAETTEAALKHLAEIDPARPLFAWCTTSTSTPPITPPRPSLRSSIRATVAGTV